MNEISKPAKSRLWEVLPQEIYKDVDSQESLAYHEAGHAVLWRLTGIPFSAIAISGDTGFVGPDDIHSAFRKIRRNDVELSKPRKLPDIDDIFRKPLAIRYSCSHLAGLQAELVFHGIETSGPVIREDNDHAKAQKILKAAFGFENLYYPELLTRYYLSRCWRQVQHTAEALLNRYKEYGLGVLRRDVPCDAQYFSRENLSISWADEDW